MKTILHLTLASAAALGLSAIITGCSANITPPRAEGPAATTTTTTVDPYLGTAQRRTTTTY